MEKFINEEEKALNSLKMGGVVLCPTDTIWGLSCDAMNRNAVKRIYEIKKRPLDKSLILLVHDIHQLKEYVTEVHPRIETLLVYHKRPLTVIYRANNKIPDYLTHNDGTIAIRVIKEPYLASIIAELNRPIVSTSANISNTKSPVSYDDISEEIKHEVDFIMFPGVKNSNPSKSSMLIKYDEEGELIFLRK